MGRPKVRPEQVETRERLLAAAERAFGARGFDAANLAEIAREAGISRPSLLYHFDSKEQLYAAVIDAAFDKLAGALQGPLSRRAPFRQRLEAAVTVYLRFLDAHPDVARLLLRELVADDGPGASHILGAAVPLLSRVERFLRRAGRGQVRPGLPLREALMDLVFGGIVRAASGELRASLFGPRDRRMELLRFLLLEEN